jgi:hypothetical protein
MHHTAEKLNKGLVWLAIALLVLPIVGAGRTSIAAPTESVVAAGEQLFYASGDLEPGETNAPDFPVSATKPVNLRLRVGTAAEPGSIDLAFFDGTETNTFVDRALDGETLWAALTLKPGYNRFQLHNDSGSGGPTLTYELWVYEVDQAPFSWSGESLDDGPWRSHIKLDFPTGGLYQFDFGVTSGRYQFLVDSNYVQKTVEAAGTVSAYVSAGLHDLYLMPDSAPGTTTDWSLDVSGPGSGNDSLPYTKSGGDLGGSGNDFGVEWLPLRLAAATKGNFQLALTGETSQALKVDLYGASGSTPIYTVSGVYGGETMWWSADLPAGVSRIRLQAAPGNTSSLAYALTVQADSSPPVSWSGVSSAGGNNSQVRFEIGTAGLYDLSYGLTAGRYQFLVDSEATIQKTVESPGAVRYYLGAGTHELTIVQDTSILTTQWSFALAGTGKTYDTLPYHKTGGALGGSGNQFDEEWLPLNVQTGGPANFELTLDGDPGDGLIVSLYQGGASVYTTPVVYGEETFWWPATLAAGVNLIQVTAVGNAGSLAYDLSVRPVPAPPKTWSGTAKDSGGNSAVQLDVAANGPYTITLDTPTGFAQVLIDGATLASDVRLMALSRVTEFLVPLTAGIHIFEIAQDVSYVTTDWTLGVEPAPGDGVVAHLTGTLDPGKHVDPQVPLFGTQNKPVNFRLAVTGAGALDLAIEDGSGGSAFAGTARAGETVWGTATLKPGQNTFTFVSSGATPLDYDLTVYEIPEAPYDWAGDSAALGDWNSHVKLSFPASGVYTFDLGVLSGRYELTVDDEYIQKIVEANGEVSYYVPSGVHLVTVVPDRTGDDTSWSLGVSAPGAANDSLPYIRFGQQLWSDPAKFNSEWLPLSVVDPVQANFKLTLTGVPTDVLGVSVYGGLSASEIASVADVHGGETVWWSADLPAGVSRIQLLADSGNAGPLAYTLTVQAKPGLPTSWSGVSVSDGNNSRARFEVDTSGLYNFGYEVNSSVLAKTDGIAPGRYQFLVDSNFIQKTVESAGMVRYFLAAGTHELTIVQDPSAPVTDWALEIAGTGDMYDPLPYHKTGGALGGSGNQFEEEWLPVNVQSGGPANFELTLGGELADGLVVSLYQGATEVYSTPVVYGGETFWWPADLMAGVNEIRLKARMEKTEPLIYDLSIHAVPLLGYNVPYTWSGVSRGTGLTEILPPAESEIEIHTPVSGTYHVALDMPEGYAKIHYKELDTMQIEQAQAVVQATQQSHFEYDVTLKEGSYLFRVLQGSDPVTTWTATVSLKSSPTPEVLSVDPSHVVNDAAHVLTILGTNFLPGAEVAIDSMALSPVTWLNSAALEAELPAGVAAGTYSVTVTNPDTNSDTLLDALEVTKPQYVLYLPSVAKNNE